MKYLDSIETLVGMKVRVYRNLTRDCFSVKCMKTNRVVAHVHSLNLKDVTFPVSQAGRERVLREKQKNVHAFVQGIITKDKVKAETKVCYNPYKKAHFFYCSNEQEIKKAQKAIVSLAGVFIS